ncbi:MAG TPA: hypothetical protein VHP38_06170 [Ruminiclostridium sp.]|nr:hypothetical protein [Ruminiclostridium sp.]
MGKDITLEHKWKERFEEYKQSGLSIKAWCLKNGLKNTTFKYWINKFNKSEKEVLASDTNFVEVLLPSSNINNKTLSESSASTLTLSYSSYSIGIADGFNPETLAELMKVLKKL